MSFDQVFSAAMERALNRLLAMDPNTMAQLAPLEGQVIKLELKGLPQNQSLYLFPCEDGFMVLTEFDGEPDTVIRGSPLAFSRLALSQESSEVLFSGDIQIDGDTALGNRIKRILQQLDIDWEEQLSKVTGDMLAHQLGNLFRNTKNWWDKSADAVQQDLGDYLQEEVRLLPAKAEVQHFIQQVDEARMSLDRLEARLKIISESSHEDETG